MNNADLRLQAIYTWLTDHLGMPILALEPASSDASFRRYFRATLSDTTWIIMDAPPERENIQPFIKMAALLADAGVNVPQLYHIETEQGFIALEDFGSCAYLDQLSQQPETANSLYQAAFATLLTLQRQPLQHLSLPSYDSALLTRELDIFYEWFLEASLNLIIPAALKSYLNLLLIESALAQPQILVHRDFHSRNLMCLEEDSPGVIDFQDAVIGPLSYDIVSILKDCYISWPPEQVAVWREAFLQQSLQNGTVICSSEQFKRWFDWMGLQRHLKAIGIFARLHFRDGKSGYLKDIPRTLAYVCAVCAAYPELSAFQHYLADTVLPEYKAQS